MIAVIIVIALPYVGYRIFRQKGEKFFYDTNSKY